MLSVDGFRADEFTGRHLGLYPGKEYEWRGMLSFSSLYLQKFLCYGPWSQRSQRSGREQCLVTSSKPDP